MQVTLDEAVGRLRLFNEKAEILVEQRSFLEKVSADGAGFRLRWSDNIVSTQRIGADDEARDAFVTTFRMFIQPKDNISISQTLDLYEQLDVPDEVKLWAKEFRQDYQRFRKECGPDEIIMQRTRNGTDGQPIVAEEEILTNELILETFIYGDIAHVNDDKRKRIQKWKSSLVVFPMIQTRFELAAYKTCKYVAVIRGNNEHFLKIIP